MRHFLSSPPLYQFAGVVAALLLTAPVMEAAEATQWQIPLGGNAYLTKSADDSSDMVDASGISRWKDPDSVFSVFFRVDRPATLDLSLRMKEPGKGSVIQAEAVGSKFTLRVAADGGLDQKLGSIDVKSPGYVRLDLKGGGKQGDEYARLTDIVVESKTDGLVLNYVRDAAEHRFYWGRRGPSVHLQYEMPAATTLEYFHNEVTVPEGRDPVGSYIMANGFGEGYFGIQVKSPQERWILFSVWSPFHTDNPRDIPADQRIELLAKGRDVRIGEFGNEGSGGQSFMIYPWKAGTTYRFLNRVHPDGKGSTVYTAWFFAPESGKWQLIASFRRPKTDKHLTGVHSFLENFHDRHGYQERTAMFGNQWVRDTDGNWHEITKASLTGDDIAQRKYRMDFAGGIEQGAFFLRNGGFFAKPGKLGSSFERGPGEGKPPVIDFATLEAGK